MGTTDESLMMMKLADRIVDIITDCHTQTPSDFQNAIDAVIMAAYYEGKNAAMQRLQDRR
jgi:hypothetical protein